MPFVAACEKEIGEFMLPETGLFTRVDFAFLGNRKRIQLVVGNGDKERENYVGRVVLSRNSMRPTTKTEEAIRAIVHSSVETYAEGFQARHIAEVDNPEGVINKKVHNVFIEALGEEIRYYSALVRSLDSSLGKMLERLAINVAELHFEVRKNVEGPLLLKQTREIAELLEAYKRRDRKPTVADYENLVGADSSNEKRIVRHDSDYYLIDKETNRHVLIELKAGGDIDNKKARSEKEAVLEQYAILGNTLPPGTPINIYFATAYNRYGEDKPWKQERVRQFFAEGELLIGKDFWNFVCKSDKGYEIVLEAYRERSVVVREALDEIREAYIG